MTPECLRSPETPQTVTPPTSYENVYLDGMRRVPGEQRRLGWLCTPGWLCPLGQLCPPGRAGLWKTRRGCGQLWMTAAEAAPPSANGGGAEACCEMLKVTIV